MTKKNTFCKKSFLKSVNIVLFINLNSIQKITTSLLFFLVVFSSVAQTERNLMPFSNKIILNPSFAGLNKNTSFWTGLQFFKQPERDVYNEYSLTYDKYSYGLNGGIAFYFRQGLVGDININTSELGFAVSRHFEANKNFFIPSLNINFKYANKQWYAQFIDHILAKKIQPPSPPGAKFGRFYRIKPRPGFLWDSENYQAGISAQFPFGNQLAKEGNQLDLFSPVFIVHLAKKVSGQKKGLVSLPFRAKPEVVLLYSKNTILSRLSLNVEEVKHTYSIFTQNDFTRNLHGIGGTFGWKIENIRLNFAAGVSLPAISDEVAFYGEVRLGLVIPPILYSKKKPWAPLKNTY